jgi:hypothetical protein
MEISLQKVALVSVLTLLSGCSYQYSRDRSFSLSAGIQDPYLIHLSAEPYWHYNFYPKPQWEYTYGLYSFPYNVSQVDFKCADIDQPYWHSQHHEHGRHDGHGQHGKANPPKPQPVKPIKNIPPKIPTNQFHHPGIKPPRNTKPLLVIAHPTLVKPLPVPVQLPTTQPPHPQRKPQALNPMPISVQEQPRSTGSLDELEKPPMFEPQKKPVENHINRPNEDPKHHPITEATSKPSKAIISEPHQADKKLPLNQPIEVREHSNIVESPKTHGQPIVDKAESDHHPHTTPVIPSAQGQTVVIESPSKPGEKVDNVPPIHELSPEAGSSPAHGIPSIIESPALHQDKVVVKPAVIHEQQQIAEPQAQEKPALAETPPMRAEKVINEPPAHEHQLVEPTPVHEKPTIVEPQPLPEVKIVAEHPVPEHHPVFEAPPVHEKPVIVMSPSAPIEKIIAEPMPAQQHNPVAEPHPTHEKAHGK